MFPVFKVDDAREQRVEPVHRKLQGVTADAASRPGIPVGDAGGVIIPISFITQALQGL